MAVKKILIVDDDAELCEELAESLKIDGYSVTHTSDPAEGMERSLKDGYDLLILDYKMHGMTGVDVLKKMKINNVKKNVFIVSGRPFVEKTIDEEGLSGMVKGILSKPVNFRLLLGKIEEL
jgi:DNA-binding response OmpR family regulator